MAVDIADDAPAIGLEALRRVVGEPALDKAVDGDAVVVVKGDELAEAERARQRAGFVRYALHEAAIAEKDEGAVVDDGMAAPVELLRQQWLRPRHGHRAGAVLAQPAGCRLAAGR